MLLGTMFGAVKSLTSISTRLLRGTWRAQTGEFSHEERVKAATEFREEFSNYPGAYVPNMRIGKYLLSVGNIVTQSDGSRKFVRQYIEGFEYHAVIQRVKDPRSCRESTLSSRRNRRSMSEWKA